MLSRHTVAVKVNVTPDPLTILLSCAYDTHITPFRTTFNFNYQFSLNSQYTTVMDSTPGSPFLRLPAELRNEIYKYALGGNTYTINMGKPRSNPYCKKYPVALLQVNRQINHEAGLFPYLYNIFEGTHEGHLKEWIKSLTHAQRTSITTIKRHQRSYILQGVQGLKASPIFWMETPRMSSWGLEGLKVIVVDVVLNRWGWATDEGEHRKAKDLAIRQLKTILGDEHPGVRIEIAEKTMSMWDYHTA